MNVQNYKYYDSNDEKQGSKFLGKNGIILISNQTDYNITQIINHLVESGLSKDNILIKKYTKNLKQGILTIDNFKKTIKNKFFFKSLKI